jgi:hypothetical protein
MRAQRLRNTIGEKLFDLANLSAAVLIFGKFLDPERVPDWACGSGASLLWRSTSWAVSWSTLGVTEDMASAIWFLVAIAAAAIAIGLLTFVLGRKPQAP